MRRALKTIISRLALEPVFNPVTLYLMMGLAYACHGWHFPQWAVPLVEPCVALGYVLLSIGHSVHDSAVEDHSTVVAEQTTPLPVDFDEQRQDG